MYHVLPQNMSDSVYNAQISLEFQIIIFVFVLLFVCVSGGDREGGRGRKEEQEA